MISISSTSKPGSNWLDRLRSSRGFPTGDEPNLDRFLTSSSSSTSYSLTRSESTQLTRRRVSSVYPQNDKNVVGNLSVVISDLFNMGGSSRSFFKKTSRKQSNPRFFNPPNLHPYSNSRLLEKENDVLCSSDDLRREKSESVIVSSGDNSLNHKNCDDNDSKLGISNNDIGENEEEKEEVIDMKEYSRSEVTVIDTSFEEWKSDKWVFRKKDEWKIKDKNKSKLNNSNKKRKLLVVDDHGECLIKEKKILHLNKPKNDKATELLKEAAEFVGKVSHNRFPCPRPPEKLRTDSSPVILLKPIPSSNNASGVIRLGKRAKKDRPKNFKII